MKSLRKVLVIGVLLILFAQVLILFSKEKVDINTLSKDYYITNGYKETSSKNLVTSIYLDYRLFDSFFEASILLVVVTGIAFMTIKDKDLE
ncbi:hypothetical protein [Helicovermis profundi]|uniref:Uncharacterized protein n=1 Tax=Helicovermis profundi TaxID=3065157 RepID=A0AAU9E121_9FIRM|nr:hypothetical protein HLPR_04500 [Clostridia bacterium S502]